ncbi:MAG: asparagine synthase (glutamine-hydrolyzing) [Acidobacteriota bacterium]|nr:asparagine synthase (glutamine-hydrolyzing) [Acidobacteriota bacterium]
MSGIAGIWHYDGRPLDSALLTRMTDAMAERGPHGVHHWIDGPIGLGHRMLHTTPESVFETQPLLDASGNLALVLDGRVDNREELAHAFKSRGIHLRADTDAELVLQAFACWGDASVERIAGDFAFSIFNKQRHRLFCARDPLGIKPFYYHAGSRTFVFGSEPRQILQSGEIAHAPNEGMIAEYLACAMISAEDTLFRGISRLPPAHCLTVELGRVQRIQRRAYFNIDPRKQIRYRADGEYAEHFLELFKEAIRCRLRSSERVGVSLSGGLDSSSVAAVARQLEPGPGFEAFSLVFPGQSCNESSFIDEVLQTCQIRGNSCLPCEMLVGFYAAQAARYLDFPDYPNGAMSNALRTSASEKGLRVLLTGLGGDEWLMGSFYHYADLLGRLRIPEFIRKVRSNAELSGSRFSWRTVLRFGLWPLVPGPVQGVFADVLQKNQVPDWIDPQFARRTDLAARLRAAPAAPKFSTFAQKDLHDVLTSGWRIHALEMEERAASSFGIEQRHPFSDRRILEFALALPEEQRWRGDQTKFVLREAMKGILPAAIRTRQTKAEFSPVFTRTFLSNGGEHLFDNLALSSLQWINVEKVHAMYRQMEQERENGDPRYTRHTCPLWMVYGIDLWYRTVLGGGGTSKQGPCRNSARSGGS